MEAIIDSLKKAGKIFYPKTKTKAVYDDNNNRLDNTLTGITDSLIKNKYNITANNCTVNQQRIYKSLNRVCMYLELIATTSASGTILATIPTEAKPKSVMHIIANCDGNAFPIRLGTDGTISLQSTISTSGKSVRISCSYDVD